MANNLIEINVLGERHSILNQFISEIRDKDIQTEKMRFRRNLERCGEIFAYEISKSFSYVQKSVQTPLGSCEMYVPDEQLVLATILRAGLPLHQGLLNYFDKAENAFISAYRKYHKNGSFEIDFGYISAPEIQGKTVILSDPMLATGASMALACKTIIGKGIPRHIHIVSLIASRDGIDYMERLSNFANITLWLGAVDNELTAKAYIVPGLGDAGDLAYGAKSDSK